MIILRNLLPAVLFTLGAPLCVVADHGMGAKLGTVRFEVSGHPDARAHVVQGVKLLHHMMYPQADQEFAAAAKIDPACALAWWGRAMTIIHPLWPDSPTDADRLAGAEFVRRGLALPSLTPRERAYLDVLGAFFGAADTKDYPARLSALDQAWMDLAETYPDDLDALAFSALFHLAPARFAAKDRSHRLQLEAVRWLQAVLARIPDHPGGQHYKIHAYDFPLLADRALEVCDTYSVIAPEVPHALHMPTHIFTRRGRWEESIEFNRRSAEAARKLAQASKQMNSHYPHANDYLAYAYLQTGRFRQAEAIRDEWPKLAGPFEAGSRGAMAFAFAAVPARCALERQDWAEASELPVRQPASFPWSESFLHCDSITHFARAIGAARSGRLDAARGEIAELERIHRALVADRAVPYWISQAESQLLAARAWVKLGEKAPEEAVALLRRAVEVEASTDKEAVTPGEVMPAGDLLGDLLIEVGRPAEALAAYQAVLDASPNRLNTLFGAGVAAERSGDPAKARDYFGRVAEVAAAADEGNKRVEHARAVLARR